MDILVYVALPLAGVILGWFIRWLFARFQLSSSEQRGESDRQRCAEGSGGEEKRSHAGEQGPAAPGAKPARTGNAGAQDRASAHRAQAAAKGREPREAGRDSREAGAGPSPPGRGRPWTGKPSPVRWSRKWPRSSSGYPGSPPRRPSASSSRAWRTRPVHDAQIKINLIEQEAKLTADKQGARHPRHHHPAPRHGGGLGGDGYHRRACPTTR